MDENGGEWRRMEENGGEWREMEEMIFVNTIAFLSMEENG